MTTHTERPPLAVARLLRHSHARAAGATPHVLDQIELRDDEEGTRPIGEKTGKGRITIATHVGVRHGGLELSLAIEARDGRPGDGRLELEIDTATSTTARLHGNLAVDLTVRGSARKRAEGHPPGHVAESRRLPRCDDRRKDRHQRGRTGRRRGRLPLARHPLGRGRRQRRGELTADEARQRLGFGGVLIDGLSDTRIEIAGAGVGADGRPHGVRLAWKDGAGLETHGVSDVTPALAAAPRDVIQETPTSMRDAMREAQRHETGAERTR